MIDYDGYTRLRPGLWRRSEVQTLRDIDSLVLDIDGVVMDVRGSFRTAVCETVHTYLTLIAGLSGETRPLSLGETQLFKLAGGFNNDWELTAAAVLFFLGKAQLTASDDLAVIASQPPSIGRFIDELKKFGSGLEAARRLVLVSFPKPETVLKSYEPRIVTQIFQEIYAGESRCQVLYGFKPQYVHSDGLVGEEKALLGPDDIGRFAPRIGVITGRARQEALLAIEMAGLGRLIPESSIIYDDGELVKPDPRTIMTLARRLSSTKVFFLGDTPDDVETVKRARETGQDVEFYSGIVGSVEDGPEGISEYLAVGADLVAVDVKTALVGIGL